MPQTVETLMHQNTYGIFSEHDARKRRPNIPSVWAEDGLFIDLDAATKDIQGVERAAAGLVEEFPTCVFTDRGEFRSYNGVGEWSSPASTCSP